MRKDPVKAYMNWSGGKDSALCLFRIMQDRNFAVESLVTSVNAAHDRVSMHGVRRELLVAQAESIGLPLKTIELSERPGMEEYEETMQRKVIELKEEGFAAAVFGDIFLEDLKQYREEKLALAGMHCVFPLWRVGTRELMDEFIDLGFKAVIVCVNGQYLDKSFCGRIIDREFVKDLPAGVDVCGESGEYHSFVFDGPVFKLPVKFRVGEIVTRVYPAPANGGQNCYRDNQPPEYEFYFCDLLAPEAAIMQESM